MNFKPGNTFSASQLTHHFTGVSVFSCISSNSNSLMNVNISSFTSFKLHSIQNTETVNSGWTSSFRLESRHLRQPSENGNVMLDVCAEELSVTQWHGNTVSAEVMNEVKPSYRGNPVFQCNIRDAFGNTAPCMDLVSHRLSISTLNPPEATSPSWLETRGIQKDCSVMKVALRPKTMHRFYHTCD